MATPQEPSSLPHLSRRLQPANRPWFCSDIMDICVSYEYSYASDPRAFIATVPTQLVADVPANIPRALLPEYIAALILQRSPTMGKLRNLKIL
jgi:hypothetical protein